MVWFYLSHLSGRENYTQKTFNPTMVWFYLSENSCEVRNKEQLSIPLWSDFIGGEWFKFNAVQPPFNPTMVWFYQRLLWTKNLRKSILSIPLWSDFIWSDCSTVFGKNTFQSHYGLILSPLEISRKICSTEIFQSHYGLILSISGDLMPVKRA